MSNCLVIVPCFNEASRIPLKEFEGFLKSESAQDFTILFVNDGSSDGTAELLNKFAVEWDHCQYLEIKKNQGKAEAIRYGVLNSQLSEYKYLAYWDADLATPLEELYRLKEYALKTDPKPLMVLGSRIKILGVTQIKRKLL